MKVNFTNTSSTKKPKPKLYIYTYKTIIIKTDRWEHFAIFQHTVQMFKLSDIYVCKMDSKVQKGLFFNIRDQCSKDCNDPY